MPLSPLRMAYFTDLEPSGRWLAWARICLALAALLKGLDVAIELPSALFGDTLRVPYFGWLPVPGPAAARWLVALWLLAALSLAAGWRSRTSAAVVAAVTAYVLALDQQLYSNHLYLLVLLAFLLSWSDCGAALSLDARRRGGPRPSVPRWPLTLIRLQLSFVYGFAAIAKANADFLGGSVIATSASWGAFPPWARRLVESVDPSVLGVGVVLAEAYLAVALWNRRLRPSAYVVGAALHLGIVVTMGPSLHLVVFAIECLAVYPLFAALSDRGTVAPAYTSRSR